jgi:hypothetical protein
LRFTVTAQTIGTTKKSKAAQPTKRRCAVTPLDKDKTISSVSSERAFSSAGITIGKHCNRLKSDIAEALQFLKCLIRRDLLFCVPEALVDDDEHQEVETEFHAEDDGQPAENIQQQQPPPQSRIPEISITTDDRPLKIS